MIIPLCFSLVKMSSTSLSSLFSCTWCPIEMFCLRQGLIKLINHLAKVSLITEKMQGLIEFAQVKWAFEMPCQMNGMKIQAATSQLKYTVSRTSKQIVSGNVVIIFHYDPPPPPHPFVLLKLLTDFIRRFTYASPKILPITNGLSSCLNNS